MRLRAEVVSRVNLWKLVGHQLHRRVHVQSQLGSLLCEFRRLTSHDAKSQAASGCLTSWLNSSSPQIGAGRLHDSHYQGTMIGRFYSKMVKDPIW